MIELDHEPLYIVIIALSDHSPNYIRLRIAELAVFGYNPGLNQPQRGYNDHQHDRHCCQRPTQGLLFKG